MTALHELTALQQADAVRRRTVSPVELVEHYLARIAADELGAFLTVTADQAREQAKEAERAVQDGGGLPALHGVPVAIKDLNLTAGVRTTLGSAAYEDFVAPIDDHVVTLLRAAGTISLGKTNTPEFGLPCYTEPDVGPPARTPWDRTRSAGGSSGGAGAAVAGGLVPFAQGSDGAGSIRIPSSVCGLYGLKVSRGRISKGPLQGDVTGLAWDGPIARTVRDAAALLDAMAVPMPGDPHWAPPLPAGETFLACTERPVGRLRVGRYRTPVVTEVDLDPDCVAAYEHACELLGRLGHEVQDVEAPFDVEHVPLFETLWSVTACGIPVPDGAEDRLRPFTRWLRDRGREKSGVEFTTALGTLQLVARAAINRLAGFDAVLTPTLAQLPRPVGGLRDDADPVADFEAQKRFAPFTAPYNLTGQPAANLPLYWTADGLPVGVQIVGPPAGEALLLALSAQLEAAEPWAHRHPPGW